MFTIHIALQSYAIAVFSCLIFCFACFIQCRWEAMEARSQKYVIPFNKHLKHLMQLSTSFSNGHKSFFNQSILWKTDLIKRVRIDVDYCIIDSQHISRWSLILFVHVFGLLSPYFQLTELCVKNLV